MNFSPSRSFFGRLSTTTQVALLNSCIPRDGYTGSWHKSATAALSNLTTPPPLRYCPYGSSACGRRRLRQGTSPSRGRGASSLEGSLYVRRRLSWSLLSQYPNTENIAYTMTMVGTVKVLFLALSLSLSTSPFCWVEPVGSRSGPEKSAEALYAAGKLQAGLGEKAKITWPAPECKELVEAWCQKQACSCPGKSPSWELSRLVASPLSSPTESPITRLP